MSNKHYPLNGDRKPHKHDGFFRCFKCKIDMLYVGIKYERVAVCVEKYDDDGEPYTTDEMFNTPYAAWKCPKCGHVETDGY